MGVQLQSNKPGCLGFLFGFGNTNLSEPTKRLSDGGQHEGNVHSGPGGYEGMSYEGGYAAEYLDEDGEQDREH